MFWVVVNARLEERRGEEKRERGRGGEGRRSRKRKCRYGEFVEGKNLEYF